MKDLVEQMYCSQQINIPPNLPFILKQYAKAAIRTQPYDLLFWSVAYFRAKAENLPLPVKERLEYPPVYTRSGLTPGFLKVLHKQLGNETTVNVNTIYEKWRGVCLKKEDFESMLKLGRFESSEIEWLKFLAIAAGHLCPVLSQTMILICETITEEPEGGSAMIPVDTFVWLFTILAQMDCGPKPLKSVHTDISVNTLVEPSANFDSVSPVTSTDVKGEVEKECSLCDMTSQDGLMVWPDIVPSDKSVHQRSAGSPSDEGLTSEHGMVAFTLSAGNDIQTIEHLQLQTNSSEETSQYVLHSIRHRPETYLNDTQDESSTDGSDDKDTDTEKGQTNPELSEKQIGISDDKSNQQNNNTELFITDNNSEDSSSSHIEKKDSTFDELKTKLVLKNAIDENDTLFDQNKNINSTDMIATKTSSSGKSTEIEKQSSVSLGSNQLFQTVEKESEVSHVTEDISKFDGSFIVTDEPYWEHVSGIGPVVPEHQLTAVVEYMKYWAAKQEGMVMPRNIKHFLCPPLDAEILATDDA